VLRTGHFGEYRASAPTRGVTYLPTTSYIEMGEWSLPAARADTFADLVAQEKAAGRWDAHKPFLRGAIWRNFLSRYPEANWMHKRMTALSARLDAIPSVRRPPGAHDLLHRAQANDAYWHGLFGGLYLPHLRRAVWNAIAALEHALDAVAARPAIESVDADLDGVDETFVRSASLQAVIRHDADAALIELTHYPLAHNFGDTLTRQREHYHRKLDAQAHAAPAGHDGIASAHDRVAFRQPITPDDARPDTRRRSLLRDAFVRGPGAAPTPPQWRSVDATGFEADVPGGRLSKRYEVDGDLLRARWRLEAAPGATPEAARLLITLDVAMPSCDGFLGRVVQGAGAILGGFGTETRIDIADAVTLEDGVLGGRLSVFTNVGARWRLAPVHSVSQSEAGFEKIMQSLCIEIDVPIVAASTDCVVTLMPGRDGN
jgi:alpha-amylase